MEQQLKIVAQETKAINAINILLPNQHPPVCFDQVSEDSHVVAEQPKLNVPNIKEEETAESPKAGIGSEPSDVIVEKRVITLSSLEKKKRLRQVNLDQQRRLALATWGWENVIPISDDEEDQIEDADLVADFPDSPDSPDVPPSEIPSPSTHVMKRQRVLRLLDFSDDE